MEKTIRVCQNTTCRKQGADKVLAAFKAIAPNDLNIEESGCLGHCGSGPNALILPENEWCLHVRPEDVSSIVEPCISTETLTAKGKASDSNKAFRLWLIAICSAIAVILLTSILIAKNSYYI